jgi:excisionase family DNA binding protein
MERSDMYLLKPAEVVELLGVSRSWLYDAANSGRIPCVRLGSSDGPVRFRLRELEAWIEEGRVAAPRERGVGRRERAPTDSKASRRRREPAADEALTQLRLLPAEGSDAPDGTPPR